MKCESFPAKADVWKQRNFYDNLLHPLMEKANKGEIALLFLDASPFVMGCDFLDYFYGKVHRFVKAWFGRKRLGAMDFLAKKIHTVVNDSHITVTEVCEMLQKFRIQYKKQELHLILIYLEYIPPYSPNLNLIERL